ncbi:hypothetical protein TNCV_4954161 [Trichonephila clavipes]|nr:hypothetical protein TNCV_4954161 [Trichonephila clavipes]
MNRLSVSEALQNLEVTPDAPTIDIERRKSEIEIGSKACQSKYDTEISVFTLSLIERFQLTKFQVQQIYRWSKEVRVVKIEAELILEANRLS